MSRATLTDPYEDGLRAAYDLAIEAGRVNEKWAADGLGIQNGPLDVALAIRQRIWSHRGTLAYRFVSVSDPEHVMIGHVAATPTLPAYTCVCGGKTDMQARGRAFEDAGPDRCPAVAGVGSLLDTEPLPDGRTRLTARAPGGVTLWRAGELVGDLECGQSMEVQSVDGYVMQTRGPR